MPAAELIVNRIIGAIVLRAPASVMRIGLSVLCVHSLHVGMLMFFLDKNLLTSVLRLLEFDLTYSAFSQYLLFIYLFKQHKGQEAALTTYIHTSNKMLSYRRETALQGA